MQQSDISNEPLCEYPQPYYFIFYLFCKSLLFSFADLCFMDWKSLRGRVFSVSHSQILNDSATNCILNNCLNSQKAYKQLIKQLSQDSWLICYEMSQIEKWLCFQVLYMFYTLILYIWSHIQMYKFLFASIFSALFSITPLTSLEMPLESLDNWSQSKVV